MGGRMCIGYMKILHHFIYFIQGTSASMDSAVCGASWNQSLVNNEGQLYFSLLLLFLVAQGKYIKGVLICLCRLPWGPRLKETVIKLLL